MTAEKRIATINAISELVETRILEGIANKRLMPQYTIERCHDDGSMSVYIGRIVPIKSMTVKVSVNKKE